MPTMPGRVVGGGGVNTRIPEPTNVNANANVDYGRNNPVRASNNARSNVGGVDMNGNFRNKNPQNVMPRAG